MMVQAANDSFLLACEKQTNWSDDAYRILLEFVSRYDIEFMTEDVRDYAEKVRKFRSPTSKRAWGGIMARAKRNNLIEAIGIRPVKNKDAHCANATIWRAKEKIKS